MSRVKLGDVAQEYKATVKDSSNLPIVGLEHLTPGEIALERWDEGTENTFTKGFKKGQMLFGRRRAYLKKAAVAPFDGVCSGDITVIEAIPGKILPELLPFIIQNDLLFDYAVGKSAGSLSPRVKWVDLKDYEFELPEIEKQTSLVDLLKAAHATRKAYQEQIKATDDLVKSQFIEMFGEVSDASPCLSDIAKVYDGTHKTPTYTETGIPFISVENIGDLYGSKKYISEEDYARYKYKPEYGDVFMTRIGSIGKCAVYESSEPLAYYVSLALIKPNRDLIQPKFLKYYIESNDGTRELMQRSLLKAFPMKINLGEKLR